MPAAHDADVPAFERFGNFMQGLATPSRGSADVMVWRTRVAPGGGPPVHKHDRDEGVAVEWIACMPSGTKTFRPDGEQLPTPWAE